MTSSAVTVPPANAVTWSSALWASRMLPSAARAISSSAASSTAIFSAVRDPPELIGDRFDANGFQLEHLRS